MPPSVNPPAAELSGAHAAALGTMAADTVDQESAVVRPLWRNWQRTCLVNRWLGVRVPSAALHIAKVVSDRSSDLTARPPAPSPAPRQEPHPDLRTRPRHRHL